MRSSQSSRPANGIGGGGRRTRWMAVLAAALGLAASAALLELGCALIWLRLESGWSERSGRVTFFYRKSANPVLGYELTPGFELDGDRGFVRIGADGLRITEGVPADATRTIVLAGDSVVFGSGHRQGETPADFLQQRLVAAGGEPVRVVNLGVPGYAFAEIREFFEWKATGIRPESAVLVVNLNDFSRRNSIYEGGDNGLYRMFSAPPWRSAYFLRKAVYRVRRGSLFGPHSEVSPEWYRWLHAANHEAGLFHIERMHSRALACGIRFGVVLFPSGQAYNRSGEYQLEEMHRRIAARLEQLEIPFVDAAGAFRGGRDRLIDVSDHPTVEGNARLAEVVAGLVEELPRER